MERRDGDARALFGASGDLCHRKIHPAPYQLTRRGLLHVPVIGVTRAGWNREPLADRVRDSVKSFASAPEEEPLEKLLAMEPPLNAEGEALRDEKVKVLRAMRPFAP